MKWPWSSPALGPEPHAVQSPAEGGGQRAAQSSNLTPTEPIPAGRPGPFDTVLGALADRAADIRRLEDEVKTELNGIAIPFDVRQRLADVFHRAYFRLPTSQKE